MIGLPELDFSDDVVMLGEFKRKLQDNFNILKMTIEEEHEDKY